MIIIADMGGHYRGGDTGTSYDAVEAEAAYS